MNWGYKLMFGFLAFAAMMITLVVKSFQTDFELVEKEYYKSELAYQDVIDGKKNAAALSSLPLISQRNDSLFLQMPWEFQNSSASGTVWLYCSYAAVNDKKYQIHKVVEGKPQFLQKPAAGNYTAKVVWNNDSIPFYAEQELSIH